MGQRKKGNGAVLLKLPATADNMAEKINIQTLQASFPRRTLSAMLK